MTNCTNVKTQKVGEHWFVTADVGDLEYQQRFDTKPNADQIQQSTKSFEENYAGLKR